ncbi:MAG TPA: hypothetical protein VNO21_21445 [Polyangiaceae bacterium]|nr:hypothetical protein [Polyangiaceae bacterium]
METSAGAGEAGQGHDEQPGDGQDTSGGSSKKLLVYAPKTYESRKDGGLINVIADVALDAATEVPGIGAIIDYVMEPDDKSASIKMQAGDAIREKLHGHAQDTSGDNPQRPLIYTPQKYESNQEGGLINTIEDIAIDGITEVPGASSIINYFSGDDDKSASVTMRAGDAIRDKMRGEGSSPPTSPDGKSSPR